MTIRALEGQKYDANLTNPANLLLGNLDFSFVLIYLFPLLIIAFTYNIIAEWIKQWMDQRYPNALQILDYYHAVEYLAQAIQGLLLPHGWLENQRKLLLESQLDQVVENVKALKYLSVEKRDKLLNYYDKNRYRMDYKAYRQAGYCIGSGAIEAAHRTLIQQRMKPSGQRWSPNRAQQLLKLRAAFKSNRNQLVTQTILKAA